MQVEIKDQRAIFHFQAPAAFEVDEAAFDLPPSQDITEIVLDFEDVKIVSSLVISKIIVLLDRHRKCDVRFENLGPELKNLFRRAGFGAHIRM